MFTVICSYPLRPGVTPSQARDEIEQTIPMYKGRAGLVRKYVALDFAQGRGCGVYLWSDRAKAEKYFAEVTPIIEAQMGAKPEVAYYDTPLVVDNAADEIYLAESSSAN
ncbi:MAG: hypothetical protein AAGH48_00300 [Pseudomonadota bacterium]